MAQRVALQFFWREKFGGIGDGAEVAPSPRKLGIEPRFFAAPDAGLPLWVVAVVMILVNGHHGARSIDHRLPGIQRLPHQPVVPEDAQDKWRHLRSIEAAGEGEVVDPFGGAPAAVAECESAQVIFPMRSLPLGGLPIGDPPIWRLRI